MLMSSKMIKILGSILFIMFLAGALHAAYKATVTTNPNDLPGLFIICFFYPGICFIIYKITRYLTKES